MLYVDKGGLIMEAKDYYSLKEIVLGLRDEYLKHYEKVEKLKALCTVDEKRVADYDFQTIQHYSARKEGKLPELTCVYEERLNQIQWLLRKIGSRISGFPPTKKRLGRLEVENGSYRIDSYYDGFPIQINGEQANREFFEQANAILETDFANNIDRGSWYNKYTSEKEEIPLPKNMPGEFRYGSITAYSSWLKIDMHMSGSELRTFWLFYNPRTDSIELNMFGENGKFMVDAKAVNDILAIEYPACELGKYHVDRIKSSENAGKDIFIECPVAKKKAKLDIEEDGKQFVLRKIENR